MELSVIPDTLSSISYSAQSFGFSNLVLNRPDNVLSLVDASLDQASQSTPQFHVSAASSPPMRTLTRPRLRKSRHVKRRLLVGNDGEGNELCVFGNGGDHGDGGGGYFGRGGGGGGKGWNFGGMPNWDDFSDNSIYDPAFDVVYEILCWIAMSNCLHFAFKKELLALPDKEESAEADKGRDKQVSVGWQAFSMKKKFSPFFLGEMANKVDLLRIGREGFAAIDEYFGGRSRPAPAVRRNAGAKGLQTIHRYVHLPRESQVRYIKEVNARMTDQEMAILNDGMLFREIPATKANRMAL